MTILRPSLHNLNPVRWSSAGDFVVKTAQLTLLTDTNAILKNEGNIC